MFTKKHHPRPRTRFQPTLDGMPPRIAPVADFCPGLTLLPLSDGPLSGDIITSTGTTVIASADPLSLDIITVSY